MTEETIMIEQAFITLGGKEILHSACIRAIKGKVVGLLGSNGSGKSTLLKCLFGSLNSSDAIVSHNGIKLKKKPFTAPALINYLPQFPMLPDNAPMRKLATLFNVCSKELLRIMPELEEDLDRTIHELSGGKERLWQTMLITLAPTRFTLLDEPFTHISPLFVERLRTLIGELTKRKGFILTDHLYRPLLEISDEVWFMKSGQTFLLRQPQDLILHGYLNHLD